MRKSLTGDATRRSQSVHKEKANPDWDLDAVVGAFAAAAVDPSLWNNAMEVASDHLGGCGAVLFPFHGQLPWVPVSQSLAPPFEVYMQDGWINRDERDQCMPTVLARGVGSDLDFTTPGNMAKDPYYQEFLAPFNLQWSAIVRVAAADEIWVMAVQRSISQGPFQKDELAKLADLSHRLSGAAAVARTLGFARADAALSAFEISNVPTIMLYQFGCILRSNEAMNEILGPDIFIRERRVRSAQPDINNALNGAIFRLIEIASPGDLLP